MTRVCSSPSQTAQESGHCPQKAATAGAQKGSDGAQKARDDTCDTLEHTADNARVGTQQTSENSAEVHIIQKCTQDVITIQTNDAIHASYCVSYGNVKDVLETRDEVLYSRCVNLSRGGADKTDKNSDQ